MPISKINSVLWSSLSKVDGILKSSIVSVNGITSSSVDPDAQAFITAAGITDPTQQSAINTLVLSLKSNSLWTKMEAIYPFVGGTSTTHKFNLKNPADTDGAFRLVFFGGATHDANGVTFNGTTGYADTFWIPSVQISSTEYASTSLYSRTNSITSTIRTDMAVNNFNYGGNTGAFVLAPGYSTASVTCYFQCDLPNAYTYTHYNAQGANANTTGFYSAYQSATTIAIYKNGSIVGSNNNAKSATRSYPAQSVFIGADRYNNSPRRYSNKNLAFAHIGTIMTDGDMSNLYTIVQAYQTTLGRQV
jgi:hypothetical protein